MTEEFKTGDYEPVIIEQYEDYREQLRLFYEKWKSQFPDQKVVPVTQEDFELILKVIWRQTEGLKCLSGALERCEIEHDNLQERIKNIVAKYQGEQV